MFIRRETLAEQLAKVAGGENPDAAVVALASKVSQADTVEDRGAIFAEAAQNPELSEAAAVMARTYDDLTLAHNAV